MAWMIQSSRRSRSLLSLAKTLIICNDLISKQQFRLRTSFSSSLHDDKSPFESNLVHMLTNEINFHSEFAPPRRPDTKFNSFMVEDRPGEQFLTLKGISSTGENIKIEATMFDGYATDQLHISLLVDISKPKPKAQGGEMLEFVCSAWPQHLEIQKFYVIGTLSSSRPHMGPHFRVLDKKVQNAVYEFLNARGINNELSVFLHHYVWNKEKQEHLQRLKLLKSYVEI